MNPAQYCREHRRAVCRHFLECELRCLLLVALTVVSFASATAQAPPDTLYARAVELIARGEYGSALSLLEGSLSSHVSHHRLQYLIGVCRFSLGNYTESVRALEAAFQGDSTSSAYCLALGKGYAALNLLPAARRMLERAMGIDGGSLAARFELLRILCMQKQFDDAKNLLGANPTQAELLVLGKALLGANRNAEALEYATQALAMDSTSFPSRLLLADALFALRRYDDAFTLYADLIMENQQSAYVARKLAFCYEKQGQRGVPVAILMMQKYLRLSGDTTASDLAKIGSWFYLRQRYDSAAVYFRMALERDSLIVELHYNYGLSLFRTGQFELAEAEFLRTADLSRGTLEFQASLFKNLGAVYVERKKFRTAVAHYKRSVELYPGDAEAVYGLAHAYDAAGDFRQAQRWYRKFLKSATPATAGQERLQHVKRRLKELEGTRNADGR
jgi:tetratricopeptide (TPR) repeat protein